MNHFILEIWVLLCWPSKIELLFQCQTLCKYGFLSYKYQTTRTTTSIHYTPYQRPAFGDTIVGEAIPIVFTKRISSEVLRTYPPPTHTYFSSQKHRLLSRSAFTACMWPKAISIQFLTTTWPKSSARVMQGSCTTQVNVSSNLLVTENCESAQLSLGIIIRVLTCTLAGSVGHV